jgi:3-hydroxyisobutyrate dehydrogenase-like beta-hydroxyacid dehydrogenase
MEVNKIGFMGFGEVGSIFAEALKIAGVQVKAYDKFWNIEPNGHRIQAKSKELGVELLTDPQKIADWAEVIISVTTPKSAFGTADMIASYVHEGQFYADLNSATPSVKQKIEHIFQSTKVKFVDGGILAAPIQTGIKTPIAFSGPNALELSEALNKFGMSIRVIGEKVGQASAFKAIRSIFTKGLESVLLECLITAELFNLHTPLLNSLTDLLSQPPETLFNILITTHAIHARRRAEEMEGVIALLVEKNVNYLMTQATMKKLIWSADLGLKDAFDGKVPPKMEDVLKKIIAKIK